MNTCDTCKFWDREIRGRLKGCDAPGLEKGYHIDECEVPDNGAHVENDEGWAIRTGPKFGCVLHEPLKEGA